jgi:hypothetical protein
MSNNNYMKSNDSSGHYRHVRPETLAAGSTMLTWSHLLAHAAILGRGVDGSVVEACARPHGRRLPALRVALGNSLIAIGRSIAGPEERAVRRSVRVAR